ncbi:hypothetical protein C2I19_21385, partial [Chromobacterium alticapitis]
QAKVTEYEYDGAGRRVRETVDPAGLKLSTRYAYDAANNVTAKTDGNGQTTRYVYDEGDRLRYTVDPLGYVSEQQYDAAGNVTDTIRYADKLEATLPRGSTDQTHSGKQAAQVWYQADTNNAISRGAGHFQAGDTVTAS